jgi:hypothetical protein
MDQPNVNIMKHTFVILVLLVLTFWQPLQAVPISGIQLDAVKKISVGRIPAEIQTVVAVAPEAFPKQAVFEVHCMQPWSSLFATKIVDAYNRIPWKPSNSEFIDVRWSVSIVVTDQKEPIRLYFGERSDVFVCDGQSYSGGKEMLRVLRAYLLELN